MQKALFHVVFSQQALVTKIVAVMPTMSVSAVINYFSEASVEACSSNASMSVSSILVHGLKLFSTYDISEGYAG